MSPPGRLLAFIENLEVSPPSTIEGHILYWEPPFNDEVAESHHLEDHNFPPSLLDGLVIFEGTVEVTPLGPDPDVEFHGVWRRLTHWEMMLVRDGVPPWSRS